MINLFQTHEQRPNLSDPARPSTLYTLFLPLNHNDGRRMQPERLRTAVGEALRFSGGLTRHYPGIGFWLGPDRVYRDLVLPIQVVTPAGSEADTLFLNWSITMAGLLEQHQIFLFSQ